MFISPFLHFRLSENDGIYYPKQISICPSFSQPRSPGLYGALTVGVRKWRTIQASVTGELQVPSQQAGPGHSEPLEHLRCRDDPFILECEALLRKIDN